MSFFREKAPAVFPQFELKLGSVHVKIDIKGSFNRRRCCSDSEQ